MKMLLENCLYFTRTLTQTLTDNVSELDQLKFENGKSSNVTWILHKEYDNADKVKCEVADFISCHVTIFVREIVLDLMLHLLNELEQSYKH